MHAGVTPGTGGPLVPSRQGRGARHTPVASVHPIVGIIDNDSPPSASGAGRLRNLGLRLVRVLVDIATVAGTATIGFWSAEVAHDLSTRTAPSRHRATPRPAKPAPAATTLPPG